MESHPTSDTQVQAQVVAHANKYRVKFLDGPAAGIKMEYEQEQPTYRYFTWTYEATGKRDDDHWVYVKRPDSRMARRVLHFYMHTTGNDPRLLPKDEPTRVIPRGRNEPCWCGSGVKYKRCHASPQSN